MKKRAAWRAFAPVTAFLGLCLLPDADAGSQVALRAAVHAQDRPDAECVLRSFLCALTKEDLKEAHALVAPSTKENGDPIAYRAKADYDSFAAEATGRAEKFGEYRLGMRREEEKGRVRIFVHFEGGDNDETLLVLEDGRWYVADPIHIIR